MTAEDYEALADRIMRHFDSQGLFSNVKEAVSQAREQLQELKRER